MKYTDILLSVDLDVSDAKSTAEKLQKEVKHIFDARSGKQSSALTALEVQMKQSLKTIDSLRERLSSLPEVKAPTEEFSKLTQELIKAQSEYDKLNSKVSEQADYVDKTEAEFVRLQKQYDALISEVNELNKAYATGNNPLAQRKAGEKLDEAARIQSQMDKLSAEMGSTKFQKFYDMRDKLWESGDAIDALTQKIRTLQDAGKAYTVIRPEETEEGKKILSQLDTANDKLKQQIVHHDELASKNQKVEGSQRRQINYLDRMKQILNSMRSTFSGILRFGRQLINTFRRLTSHSKSTQFSFKKLMHTLIKYAFGVRSFYFLWRKFRTSVKQGFDNLTESSERFRETMQGVKSSLLQLKNSFITVLEPVISAAAPHIEAIADQLSAMFEQLAKFTAATLGQKYYMRAIKQTGRAAEKTKQQLSGLDNLNVLNGKTMFEEIPLDEDQVGLLEAFADILKRAEELGKKFGKYVVNNLKKIDWKKIKSGVNGVATGITDFANGILDAEDIGETFGETVAELGNTITGFGKTLVENFNFKKAGEEFGKSVQTFIDTYNWDDLGTTLGEFIRGAVEFAWNFAMQIDVDTLSDNISKAINNFLDEMDKRVDGKTGWERMGETLAKIATLIIEIIKKIPWGRVIQGLADALATAWNSSPPELGLALGAVTILSVSKVILGSLVHQAIQAAFTGAVGGLNIGGAGASGAGAAGAGAAGATTIAGLAGKTGLFANILDAGIGGVVTHDLLKLIDNVIEDFTGSRFFGTEPFFKEVETQYEEKLSEYEAQKAAEESWARVEKMLPTHAVEIMGYRKYTQFTDDMKQVMQAILASGYQPTINALDASQNSGKFDLSWFGINDGDLTALSYDKGVNIIEGLKEGAIDAYNKARGTFFTTWEQVIADAKKVYGINSPSKVFAEIGEYLDLGLAKGIRSEQSAVEKAMGTVLATTGLNIPSISKGAVVPRTKAFSASMNGTSNQTALVDALQRVINPVSSVGGTNTQGTQEIVLNLDGREFMRAMIKQNGEYKKQHNGASAFA